MYDQMRSTWAVYDLHIGKGKSLGDQDNGTIIRTGITSTESLVICATHLAGGLLLKMLKKFEVMLNSFEFAHV